MIAKIKDWRDTDKKSFILIKIFLSFLVSIVFGLWIEKVHFSLNHLFFSYDRIIIFSIIAFFALMHVFFNIRKLYAFIYKKRYFIAGFVLLFVVIMKYSGSSITTYSMYIQPDIVSEYDVPILGQARGIRSDEWLVSTEYALSQSMTETKF